MVENNEISTGEDFVITRGEHSETYDKIRKAMIGLKKPEGGKKPFIFIPQTMIIVSTVSTALPRLKEEIRSSEAELKEAEYTLRTVKDANKKVLGTRIYRTN